MASGSEFAPFAEPATSLLPAGWLRELPGVSRPVVLRRRMDSTGSRLDADGHAHYARLAADPAHVGAVLTMMAVWDLRPMLHDLPRLQPPLQPRLHQVVGSRDGTVPPRLAVDVNRLVPGSRLHTLPGLGHLAHEEDPAAVACLLREFAQPAVDTAADTPD